jgi:hypothetical protein
MFHDIPTTIASLPNLAKVGGSVHMFTSTCDIELQSNCEKAVTKWSISMHQLITAMKGTTGLVVVATLWIAVREPTPEPKVIQELRQSLREADWDSTSLLITNCLHGGKVACYHWVVVAGLKTFMSGWNPPVEMDEGSSAVVDILDEGEPDEAQFMLLDMFDMKEISAPVPTGETPYPRVITWLRQRGTDHMWWPIYDPDFPIPVPMATEFSHY